MGCSSRSDVSIRFLLGEKRPLKFTTTYPEFPEFIISSAKYEIYSKGNKVLEGDMSIDVHDVGMTYEASERGYFDLYIILEIGGAIRKKHFLIDVD